MIQIIIWISKFTSDLVWSCLYVLSQNLLDSTCYLCKSRLLYFATVLILKTLTIIRLTTFLCTSSQCFSHLVHFFAIVSLFGIVHDLLSQGGVDLNTCKINYLCHLRPGNVLYLTPKKNTVQKGRHFDLGATKFKTLCTMTLTRKVYILDCKISVTFLVFVHSIPYWLADLFGACCSAKMSHKLVKTSSAKHATSAKSLLSWFIYCDS